MTNSIQQLCAALDCLQLSEQAFARGEAVDIAEFMQRKQAVLTAARAARPALECLKAGVSPKRLTVQAEARGVARGASDRARMEVVA